MPGIGEPESVPPPPAVKPEYPAVGESRGNRPTKPMTAEERAKLEAELAAARSNAAAQQRQKINQPAGQ